VNSILTILRSILLLTIFFSTDDLNATPQGIHESLEAFTKLSLHVGSQRLINIEKASKISVSRKGIVHLFQTGPQSWTVTGMRSGIAVIEVSRRGSESKTIYVEVLPRETLASPNRTPDQAPQLPESHPNNLTKAYTIKAKIELLETLADTVDQTRGEVDLTADLISGTIMPKLNVDLFETTSSMRRSVIGEPIVRVLEATTAQIKSGGEIYIQGRDGDGKDHVSWHEFGLNLSITIKSSSESAAICDFVFSLKSPTAGESNFSLNHIQSVQRLAYNQYEQVGQVDLSTNDSTAKTTPLLAQVPIIGPWFLKERDSKSHAKVALSIMILRD
jgi:hypothetical protein